MGRFFENVVWGIKWDVLCAVREKEFSKPDMMANIISMTGSRIMEETSFWVGLQKISWIILMKVERYTPSMGKVMTEAGVSSCIRRRKWPEPRNSSFCFLPADCGCTVLRGLVLLMPGLPSTSDCALQLWLRTKLHSSRYFQQLFDHCSKKSNSRHWAIHLRTQKTHKSKTGNQNIEAKICKLKNKNIFVCFI